MSEPGKINIFGNRKKSDSKGGFDLQAFIERAKGFEPKLFLSRNPLASLAVPVLGFFPFAAYSLTVPPKPPKSEVFAPAAIRQHFAQKPYRPDLHSKLWNSTSFVRSLFRPETPPDLRQAPNPPDFPMPVHVEFPEDKPAQKGSRDRPQLALLGGVSREGGGGSGASFSAPDLQALRKQNGSLTANAPGIGPSGPVGDRSRYSGQKRTGNVPGDGLSGVSAAHGGQRGRAQFGAGQGTGTTYDSANNAAAQRGKDDKKGGEGAGTGPGEVPKLEGEDTTEGGPKHGGGYTGDGECQRGTLVKFGENDEFEKCVDKNQAACMKDGKDFYPDLEKCLSKEEACVEAKGEWSNGACREPASKAACEEGKTFYPDLEQCMTEEEAAPVLCQLGGGEMVDGVCTTEPVDACAEGSAACDPASATTADADEEMEENPMESPEILACNEAGKIYQDGAGCTDPQSLDGSPIPLEQKFGVNARTANFGENAIETFTNAWNDPDGWEKVATDPLGAVLNTVSWFGQGTENLLLGPLYDAGYLSKDWVQGGVALAQEDFGNWLGCTFWDGGQESCIPPKVRAQWAALEEKKESAETESQKESVAAAIAYAKACDSDSDACLLKKLTASAEHLSGSARTEALGKAFEFEAKLIDKDKWECIGFLGFGDAKKCDAFKNDLKTKYEKAAVKVARDEIEKDSQRKATTPILTDGLDSGIQGGEANIAPLPAPGEAPPAPTLVMKTECGFWDLFCKAGQLFDPPKQEFAKKPGKTAPAVPKEVEKSNTCGPGKHEVYRDDSKEWSCQSDPQTASAPAAKSSTVGQPMSKSVGGNSEIVKTEFGDLHADFVGGKCDAGKIAVPSSKHGFACIKQQAVYKESSSKNSSLLGASACGDDERGVPRTIGGRTLTLCVKNPAKQNTQTASIVPPKTVTNPTEVTRVKQTSQPTQTVAQPASSEPAWMKYKDQLQRSKKGKQHEY